MSKIILYVAQSVDGYIATKEGEVTWLDQFGTDSEDYGYHDFIDSISSLVMGANTYKQILEFGKWPYQQLRSVVFSHKELEILDNANVEFYSGEIKPIVNDLKKDTVQDIWLVGGGKLVQSFLEEGFINELQLFTMPVLLGEGIPLFNTIEKSNTVTLTKSKEYDSGVVETRYAIEK